MAALVPELAVTDWARSRAFYVDLLGFAARYDRPEEGFSYLDLNGAELMIDQLGLGRDFDQGFAHPFGRGVNLSIKVEDAAALAATLLAAGHALHLPLEDRWYGVGDQQTGNRQFIIADPDGYLLRFVTDLGRRSPPR
ncbi:bleomycin resistance protein [Gemmobacter serpentinus]|uniref:bleomycin resistance protein n=1 Tax=Gemmobacter serpentinus TaxID=2652247 RepID=UPI00124CCEB6|nr:VOC family protein [Gemmobacter serpentinus]